MSEPTFARPDRFFVILWACFLPFGALLGWIFFPEAWGLWTRLGVGVGCGAGCALILTVNRLFGAYNVKE